ncbi:MAG: hypothetical protein P4L27_00075 [Ignavibacteriaceae bacterium]|nr:hypothetical protein [Ignavibacteriaceae bacterium]
MTCTDSNIKIISPFLQGIAGCFDIAAFFDDIIFPVPKEANPLARDWQAVSSDYNNSLKFIHEEFNAAKKKP